MFYESHTGEGGDGGSKGEGKEGREAGTEGDGKPTKPSSSPTTPVSPHVPLKAQLRCLDALLTRGYLSLSHPTVCLKYSLGCHSVMQPQEQRAHHGRRSGPDCWQHGNTYGQS